jgi:hypothetical protein
LVSRATSATHSESKRFSVAFFLASMLVIEGFGKGFGLEVFSLDLLLPFGGRESLLSERQSLQYY